MLFKTSALISLSLGFVQGEKRFGRLGKVAGSATPLTHRSLLKDNRVIADDSKYPSPRFIPWDNLSTTQIEQALALGYDQDSWNNPGTAGIEKNTYANLNNREQEAAASFGFADGSTWDCYMNHYNGYEWADLKHAGVQYYFQLLGFTEAIWSETEDGSASETQLMWDADWQDLDEAQKTAAREICFQEETWDGVDLSEWRCTKDHYNSNTWDELEEIGVQKYLITLGWTKESWDGNVADATEEPTSWTDKKWDDLTKAEQTAALHLCFFKDSWNGPADSTYPAFRFRPWKSLAEDMHQAAKTLSYTENKWNHPGTSKIEDYSYEDLDEDEKDAAKTLGFTEASWNCWQNHYEDFSWDDLDARFDVQTLYIKLNYTRAIWEGDDSVNEVEELDWKDLTPEQQYAAEELCYLEPIWDEKSLEQWGCSTNNCYCHYNWYSWNDLATEGVQRDFVTLGWTQDMWDNETGEPSTLKTKWDKMSPEQQQAATDICYTRVSWDKFMVSNESGRDSKRTHTSNGIRSSSNNSTSDIVILVVVIVGLLALLGLGYVYYKKSNRKVKVPNLQMVKGVFKKKGAAKPFSDNEDNNISPMKSKPWRDDPDDDVVESYSDSVEPTIEKAVPA